MTKWRDYFLITYMSIGLNILFISTSNAQSYTEVSKSIGIDHYYGNGSSGGGVSFFDFDKDGWDDITLATQKSNQIFFYKNNNGSFEKLNNLISNTCESKQLLWIDYDNDADMDLYVTCFKDINRLYQNQGDLEFIDVTEVSGLSLVSLKSIGASWGDINNDGWLDLYITNKVTNAEENINNLFMNNKDGSFSEISILSNSTDPGKKPFCISFIDINNDLFPDIYIAQDKKAVNTMLMNLGDTTFSDISVSSHSDLVMDGMSVTVGDYDNDGDLDIYVTNIPEGNKLLRNNGDETFTEIAEIAGVSYYGYGWGANFLDYNNDGFDDLYVSGQEIGKDGIPSLLYTNNGKGGFDVLESGMQKDTVMSISNAVGDINNDGYPDIVVNNFDIYPSMLWKNTGGNNNWIKIQLRGVDSNRDGIGSFISVYSGPLVSTRYTQSATGFLAQNTANHMIGVGENTLIDSVIISWPSGNKDILKKLPSNKPYRIVEGSTHLPPRIYQSSELTICEGDSIVLETGYYSDYEWNQGGKSRSITVREEGEYFVKATNEYGAQAISDTVHISVKPLPKIQLDIVKSSNYPGYSSVKANVMAGTKPYHYLWSVSGKDTNYIDGIENGKHYLTVKDSNGCLLTKEFVVDYVTGLKIFNKEGVTIHPNPFLDEFIVRLQESLLEKTMNVQVFNLNGKMVMTDKYELKGRPSISVLMKDKPQGIYFVKIFIGPDLYTFRVVKSDD